MFYVIYQTTNLINNKIYIGSHKTKDLNDAYMGSGKYLNRAFIKYGIENFKKEILFEFDNAKDMYAKEAELVNIEFLKRNDVYNLKIGGKGGFDYINKTGLNGAVKGGNTPAKNGKPKGPKHTKEQKEKRSKRMLSDLRPATFTFAGRKHNNDTKVKLRNFRKNKFTGKDNSQYNTMWITNGVENKKISIFDTIDIGWYKGRVIK